MRVCVACRAELTAQGWDCSACGLTPPVRDGVVELSPPLEDAHGGFGVEGFAELYAVESRHFWFRARNALIAWAVGAYFPRARSMLEVGCGTGFVLAHLERTFPAMTLHGGEAYPEALAFAATRLRRASLYQLDVRRLPFRDELDVVGAFDVLEHVPEDEAALAEICAALRPGGGLVVTVPQHPWLWSDADAAAHHVRRYTRRDLTAKLARAGFSVRRATSFVSALLLPMVASRVLSRRAGASAEARVAREFAPPRAVNAALEAVLGVERAAVRAGLSLPAGGSLLVVAERASR